MGYGGGECCPLPPPPAPPAEPPADSDFLHSLPLPVDETTLAAGGGTALLALIAVIICFRRCRRSKAAGREEESSPQQQNGGSTPPTSDKRPRSPRRSSISLPVTNFSSGNGNRTYARFDKDDGHELMSLDLVE